MAFILRGSGWSLPTSRLMHNLGQICMDFRDLSDPVIQLLSTYLKEEKVDYGGTDAPADIGEIIRIIALMSQNPPEKTHESPRQD